jgi:OOP family OmpA-OmpF porin
MLNSKIHAPRPTRVAAGFALACALLPRHAHAQYSLGQEYSKGFSLLRFEPAPAGDRFFGVRDAYVPGNVSSRFRAAIIGNVPVSPLLTRTDNATGKSVDIVSKQFVTHFDVSYLATNWLLLNADLPLVVSQSGDGQTSPSGSALGDTRLGVRFGLVGGENKPLSIGPSLDVWLPTGSPDSLTGDGHVRAQPMFTVGGREGAFVWSAGAGVLLRRKYDSGSQEIGNSWALGGAAGVLFLDDALQVGLESYGSTLISPVHGQPFNARNTAFEGVFGARVHANDFVFGAAFGPSFAEAPGSASRVLFNVAFAPQLKYERPALVTPLIPNDRDQDGIADAEDGCPDQRGPARPDPEQNGCPDVTPLHLDRDDDGVADTGDACPTVAGVASTDRTKNGCPVVTEPAPPPPPPPREVTEKLVSAQAGPAQVTFAGFRSLPDGRSLVTIELTGPIAVEFKKSGDVITYTLIDTKVPERNNENPLLTNDFPSSIVSAKLVDEKKAKSARLILVLRDDFVPKHRLVRRNSGTALEIELPARQGTETGTATPNPASPK